MTIGWVEQFIDGGIIVDGLEDPAEAMAGLQSLALISGSFLAGAMASLSLVAVPVFLDTTRAADQLYIQWARLYHHGHLLLPVIAVTTLFLYAHIGLVKRRLGRQYWRPWLVAGLVTVLMVPFTWVVMTPTNNTLFRLESEARAGGLLASSGGLDEAQELVKTWSFMHLSRTMFPLVGAVLGALATINRFRF
ncbi:hypothetical protein PG994_003278 [Apiospora phragmitis]|uniref:DUF1772 domain-containing protein n=1 Tax=Apiospora phragmitis TaxID=2905665 RepID=A0ABR1VXL7_9PEZI